MFQTTYPVSEANGGWRSRSQWTHPNRQRRKHLAGTTTLSGGIVGGTYTDGYDNPTNRNRAKVLHLHDCANEKALSTSEGKR